MTCLAPSKDFVALRPVWRQFAERQERASIFLSPEWHEAWWEQFGHDDTSLRLLTIGPEERPLGLAPMLLVGDTLTFIGDTDLWDYHDFLIGDNDPAAFYGALVDCLSAEPWATMDLRSVVETSPVLSHLLPLLRSEGMVVTVEDEDVVPGLTLPASWDDYLSLLSKKDRHELRRKLRRLEGAGAVRVVSATTGTLDADVSSFIDLMSESREEKRDFLQPERQAFFRSMARRMADLDYLRLSFLEIDGARAAATLCFDYAGTRFLYNSGYRHAYASLSAGLALKALCLKDAIERGLGYFDFLRGDEPYKYDLGGKDVKLHRILVQR